MSEFKIGDRVMLTEYGLDTFARMRGMNREMRATVVGYSHNPDCFNVIRDGHRTRERYAKVFWTAALPTQETEKP